METDLCEEGSSSTIVKSSRQGLLHVCCCGEQVALYARIVFTTAFLLLDHSVEERFVHVVSVHISLRLLPTSNFYEQSFLTASHVIGRLRLLTI